MGWTGGNGAFAELTAELRAVLASTEVKASVVAALERLAPDPRKPPLLAWLREGIEKGDDRWELRSALRSLARVLRPRTYLEIGVRRGWSLVQVVSEVPDVHAIGCDVWEKDYGGAPNPGPSFVRDEMRRAVPHFRGRLDFVSGDSHPRLPVLFGVEKRLGAEPGDELVARLGAELVCGIDLVTVDGDHTEGGAWQDLLDVMPHVTIGGAVVFDDIAGTGDAKRLRPVWERLKIHHSDWDFLESPGPHGMEAPGAGIAVRSR